MAIRLMELTVHRSRFAIARAKLAETTDAEVLALAETILQDQTSITGAEGEFWKWAYAPATLRQSVLFARG